MFRVQFLKKYFPEDVRSKKEIEFLELKQGKMTVAENATKFEELVKFYPHYIGVTVERLKCIKFENRLHPEIKQGIANQEIHMFHMLVNRCRIYDEDYGDRYAHYKSISEKRGKN